MKAAILAMNAMAESKVQMMKQRPGNYFLQTIFGGLFIGFGILLIVTIGGLFGSYRCAKHENCAGIGVWRSAEYGDDGWGKFVYG